MGTYRLFRRPTFLRGIASVVDVGGTLHQYNKSHTAAEADQKALKSDWDATGSDLFNAIEQFNEPKSDAKE